MQLSGGNIPSRDLLLQLISIEEKVYGDMTRGYMGWVSPETVSTQINRINGLRGLLNRPDAHPEFQN